MRQRWMVLAMMVMMMGVSIGAVTPKDSLCSEMSVKKTKVRRGQMTYLLIDLANSSECYNGFQMNIQLPEGFTLLNNDEFTCEPSNRFSGKRPSVIISNKNERNVYKILLFSMGNTIITGNSGLLLSIPISCESDLRKGSYQGHLTNIIFNTLENKASILQDVDFQIKVK